MSQEASCIAGLTKSSKMAAVKMTLEFKAYWKYKEVMNVDIPESSPVSDLKTLVGNRLFYTGPPTGLM